MKYFIAFIFLISFVSCKIKTAGRKEPENVAYNSKNPTAQPDSITPTGKHLLRDCPEEYIDNAMPDINSKPGNKNSKPKEYYIYSGMRKEIADFDTAWVRKNCAVKRTIAQ